VHPGNVIVKTVECSENKQRKFDKINKIKLRYCPLFSTECTVGLGQYTNRDEVYRVFMVVVLNLSMLVAHWHIHVFLLQTQISIDN
jgi:hypothetical protein